MYRMLKLHSNFSQGALSCQYTFCKYGAFRAEEVKKRKKEQYLELDWLLEDRGATGGLVLCPETVLRHDTVAEGWDLERQKKRVMLCDKAQICAFTTTNGILQ